jgi:hypothetical protein
LALGVLLRLRPGLGDDDGDIAAGRGPAHGQLRQQHGIGQLSQLNLHRGAAGGIGPLDLVERFRDREAAQAGRKLSAGRAVRPVQALPPPRLVSYSGPVGRYITRCAAQGGCQAGPGELMNGTAVRSQAGESK